MFRLLALIFLAAAAFVLIEARWSRESLTLTLRVRTAKELIATTQGRARELGERAMERVVGESTPPVGAAPPGSPPQPAPESLRESDRAHLNRLVEEKSRER
ncbi:MAG: hypothetical protein ACHQ6T_06630 [Myxococcota bacterium]